MGEETIMAGHGPVIVTDSSRRRFFKQAAALGVGGMLFRVPGVFAEQLAEARDLTLTPQQTEGPYYPNRLPLDTDNDLLVINDSVTPAVGEIVQLNGKILTPAGSPVRNAEVEIWQADNTGAYIHSDSAGYPNRDRNFQGYGRFQTDSTGEYLFRTIKPALYEGRTRHIHIKVTASGQPALTSQFYFEDEPANREDNIWSGMSDEERRAVTSSLVAMAESTVGARSMSLDVVLGAEATMGRGASGGGGRGTSGGGRFGRRR
jgi:protocatechuate 3,4-dioxygenase beta subunit